MRGDQPPTEDLTIDGKRETGIVSKLAFLRAYGMEFELIQPIGDSAFKTWLEEHGPGIHHIAAVTDDNQHRAIAEEIILKELIYV